ncbi:F-box only protein 21, partial [Armadillidium nasatum]
MIYMALSHRLGIPLQLIRYEDKLLFKWKPSDKNNSEIIIIIRMTAVVMFLKIMFRKGCVLFSSIVNDTLVKITTVKILIRNRKKKLSTWVYRRELSCTVAFLFICFIKSSENVEVTHPYYKINWQDLSETERSLVCQYPCSTKSFLIHLAHDSFHSTDESSADFGFVTEKIAAAGMILLLSSFPGDNDDSLFWYYIHEAANFCLKNELHIETIAEICGKNFNNISSVEGKMKIRNISADAQRLLSVQRKGPKPIKAKRRRKETLVKFATGMIVNVNSDDRCGVIFGWDEIYRPVNDPRNESDTSSFNLRRDQPFYSVLLRDGSTCYVPQESVTFRWIPCPINQFEVGRYFERFNDVVYEPNPEHSSEYPDEDRLREEISILNRLPQLKKTKGILGAFDGQLKDNILQNQNVCEMQFAYKKEKTLERKDKNNDAADTDTSNKWDSDTLSVLGQYTTSEDVNATEPAVIHLAPHLHQK